MIHTLLLAIFYNQSECYISMPNMTLPAVHRAVTTARTSQGFSYTLKAPYEKAMQRYAHLPHSQNLLTCPFLRSYISKETTEFRREGFK